MVLGASRWLIRAAWLMLAAAATCAMLFMRMPGRSGKYILVSREDLERSPQNGVVSSGPLRWDVTAYAEAPALEPLRAFFRAQCANRAGLDAAICLGDTFATKFVEKEPKRDLFDHDYDPVADLRAHLAGEAGHCVTRSGLSVAVLLSTGVPARVVQLLGAGVPGHTIIEVWDARWGWVAFDPTYGRLFESDNGPRSAAAALIDHAAGQWVLRGKPAVDHGDSYYADMSTPSADAAIRFPEPWLYMRTGPHVAAWPYRAVFAHGGSFRWSEGRGQELVRELIVVFVFAAVVALAISYTLRRRLNRRVAVRAADGITAT